MKILDLIQGSEAWLKVRLSHFTASEAPAMMGASKYQSRDALLKMKATGISPEVCNQQQKIFDRGHAAEALARPIVEVMIGDDLYPITASLEVEGLQLLGSFDGLTMSEETGFEHKLLNAELVRQVNSGELEPHYFWQLEQLLLISRAKEIIFVTSDGTELNFKSMRYCPVAGRRDELIAGWKQFAKDLAEYVAPEAQAPKAVAEPVASLPAINYQIDLSNGISLRSNLDSFKAAAQVLVENSKVILVSDQDFEDAKARIKECEKAESNIKALIDRVLGELGDVDTFKTDLESIGGWIRQSRLNQDKQVKTRSTERKAEIINAGKALVSEHIDLINKNLAPVFLPNIAVDFDAAVFRKSSFENMQSGVNDAVAAFKIEANCIAAKIESNLELLRMIAADHMNLFADLQQVCLMDSEPLRAIALRRIEDAKQAEQERIQAAAQKIAADQLAKDKAEQERIANEQAEINRQAMASHAPAADEIVMRRSAMSSSVVQERPDHSEPTVGLTDYQRGIIAGIELAKNILIKNPTASHDDLFLIFGEFIEAKTEQLEAA